MIPIHDKAGQVVAWLNSDDLLDLHGVQRAFVDNGSVVAYDGRHLGTFNKGFFRDRFGAAVTFVKGASGGPVLPIPAIPPFPPFPNIAPFRPIPPIPPIFPIPLLAWSSSEWDSFLLGG